MFKFNLILSVLFTGVFLGLATPASADIKLSAKEKTIALVEKVGSVTHSALSKAQRLGFLVNEVRFEISVLPKIEVYFQDDGDTGQFDQLMTESSKSERNILRLLQATRKFSVVNYSPTGVLLVVGATKPSVTILTKFPE